MGRKKRVDFRWSVDPGNAQTGLALWQRNVQVHDGPALPWCLVGSLSAPLPGLLAALHESRPRAALVTAPGDLRADLVGEVPQNGTHQSRGGVHYALGVTAGILSSYSPGLLGRVRKVTPHTWRAVYKRPDLQELRNVSDWKEKAMLACNKLGYDPGTHDEAEAILIGVWANGEDER